MASRRDEILELAAELFAAHSYEGTSMRDIAQASGIKISSLYSHFRSKAEIFEEIVRPLVDAVTAAQLGVASERAPGYEVLRTMVQRVVGVCMEDQRAMAILHYSWPQLRTSADHTALVTANAAVFARWREAIDAGIADGSIRNDLDPHLVARMLTSALQGLVDRERYLERTAAASGHEDAVITLIDELVLSGIRPSARSGAMSRGTTDA